MAEAARDLRWWFRGVTGADAYERYAAHMARTHPGSPVLSERDFWRQKYADQDANPGARCC
ncbi:YbdD/YjiX family protein [Actinomycetota bacterium]